LDGAPATMDRIGALPLLDAVIRETMRILTPVPLLMRKATHPTRLGDDAIAQGDRVLISALVINRDPKIYPEPDRFEPDRWLSIKPSPYQYPVFGAGGHMCPGVTFGLQMMKISLATILAENNLELAPGGRAAYRIHVTLAPKGKVELIFRKPREKSIHRPLAGPIRGLLDLPSLA
jgi:cytochrome P450